MGLVVELCGLPGAGKSTFAHALVARLRHDGVPAVDVMAPLGPDAGREARLVRKAAMVGRAAWAPGSWRIARDVGLHSGQAGRRDRIARPLNLVVVRAAVARATHRAGVHVLDQGPLQEWWSAALRADRSRVLAWAAADGPTHADLLVRVETPVEVLVERLAARPGAQSRLEGMDADAQRAELASGAALLDALTTAWETASGGARRLLRVDARDTAAIDTVVAAIAGRR